MIREMNCNNVQENTRNYTKEKETRQNKNLLDLLVNGGFAFVFVLLASDGGLRQGWNEFKLLLHLLKRLEDHAGHRTVVRPALRRRNRESDSLRRESQGRVHRHRRVQSREQIFPADEGIRSHGSFEKHGDSFERDTQTDRYVYREREREGSRIWNKEGD